MRPHWVSELQVHHSHREKNGAYTRNPQEYRSVERSLKIVVDSFVLNLLLAVLSGQLEGKGRYERSRQ